MLVRGPGSAAGTKQSSTTERVKSVFFCTQHSGAGGWPGSPSSPKHAGSFRVSLPTPQVLSLLPCQSQVGSGSWEGHRSGRGQHVVLMDKWPLLLPPPFHRWALYHMPSLESMGDKECPLWVGMHVQQKLVVETYLGMQSSAAGEEAIRSTPGGQGGPQSPCSPVPSTEQACSRC